MAREATISQEQVNAAADAIRAGGVKPTARAVRESLGAGSMATVLKFLQVWQGGQVSAKESPVVLPAGLQGALVDFIEKEVSSAKAGLQDDLATAQKDKGDLIAESERQAATIELQAEALETAQAEKAELTGRLAQVESDLAKAGDDVAAERHAAELARTELAKAQLRLEALPRIEAEADRLRAELEAERTAKVAAEQAAAVALAKLEAMTDRATKAEARADQVEREAKQIEQEVKQAIQELNSVRHQVQAQQIALDASARELDAAKRATTEARAEAKQAGESAAELKGQLAALAAPSEPSTTPTQKTKSTQK